MLDRRFAIAPMMDWTGTSQKTKYNQHLSNVLFGHVVPNAVLNAATARTSERFRVAALARMLGVPESCLYNRWMRLTVC